MNYIEMLKEKGLKATPQRICVLKSLDKHTHPTIDELYNDIKEIYPSISLATVYKNLNALIDSNIAVEVNIPNKKSKYDIYAKPHIHVVCDKCGCVHDVFQDDIDLKSCREDIEQHFGAFVKKLNLVAVVDSCKNCEN